jgi:hypothetical protein
MPSVADGMRIAIELSAREFDKLAGDAAKNSLCIQEQIIEAIRYCHRNRVSFLTPDALACMQRMDGEAA